MTLIRLTKDAQSDLINIRHFTAAKWGETQSQKYLNELWQTLSLIAQSPSIGRGRQDVGFGVMSYPHKSHVVYYLELGENLVVFGVLHQRMLPSNHLGHRLE